METYGTEGVAGEDAVETYGTEGVAGEEAVETYGTEGVAGEEAVETCGVYFSPLRSALSLAICALWGEIHLYLHRLATCEK